jgi:hypothetical protein
VLEAIGAPEETDWRFVSKPGGGWLIILRLPDSKEKLKSTFDLVTWALPKDDDELVRDLGTK